MKKPTLDILDSITPEYDQYQALSPDIVRQNEYTSNFSLNNQGWNQFYKEISNVNFAWNEIKYEDVVNKTILLDEIIPKTIGVYLFVVRPLNLINGLPKYVCYVGIAGANGSNRTLNARIKDYTALSQLKKRDAIKILIFKHYKNIFINYSSISLPHGLKIEDIEKSLIGFFGTHLIANKDDIPISLQPQSKAFNI